MTRKNRLYTIALLSVLTILTGCDGMARLFHGEKPEAPTASYTVSFRANGASGSAPGSQTQKADSVIILPDQGGLTYSGNVFTGWSESASGGTVYAVGSPVTVKRDMVFYAQWLDGSTPRYTVSFNPNGASSGSAPAPQTVYRGISITVPGQGTLVYTGRRFGGWNTRADGGGTAYAEGASLTVTENITLYARWQSETQYTVTYHANGAGGTPPAARTVDPGTVITLPGAGSLSCSGKVFKGWNTSADGTGTAYAEGASYTVNAGAILYAQWSAAPVEPPGSTLAEKLAYIAGQADNGAEYDIVVNEDEYLNPIGVSTRGKNVTITIRSASAGNIKSIWLEAQGALFSVGSNITLKLQNITLEGISSNNSALVVVGPGAALVLEAGSKISGNTNTKYDAAHGGGVYVNGGTLTMNGGEISGNTCSSRWGHGGGIFVTARGTVVITGGFISYNTATNYWGCGGGIFIHNDCTVTMSGGTIASNGADYGGEVYVSSTGTFIKRRAAGSETSGTIYGSSGDSFANTISSSNNGAALYRDGKSKPKVNRTLGEYDEISSNSDVGWEEQRPAWAPGSHAGAPCRRRQQGTRQHRGAEF